MRPNDFTTLEELRCFTSIKTLYYIGTEFKVQEVDTSKTDVILNVGSKEMSFTLRPKDNSEQKDDILLPELFSNKQEAERKSAIIILGAILEAAKQQQKILDDYKAAITLKESNATSSFNYFSQKSLKWWLRFKTTPELILLVNAIKRKLNVPMVDSDDRRFIVAEIHESIEALFKTRFPNEPFVSEDFLVAFYRWWDAYKASHGMNFKKAGRPPKVAPKRGNPSKAPVNVDTFPKDETAIFSVEDVEAIRKAVTSESAVSYPQYEIGGYPSCHPMSYGNPEEEYPEFDS